MNQNKIEMTIDEKNLLLKSLTKWRKKWSKEKTLKGISMSYQGKWILSTILNNSSMSKENFKLKITEEINSITSEYNSTTIKQRLITLNCRLHVLKWMRNTLNYDFTKECIINICNNVL